MAKALKKSSSSLASDEQPKFMQGLDSDRGQEGVGLEDLTIPRLSLIQDLSPQRKKNDPEYIQGAEEGMLFNTVTRELYGERVNFVPCYYRKEFVIWKSQSSGGGFHGAFPTESAAKAEFREQEFGGVVDKKGDPIYEINDTGQQFGLIVSKDGDMEDIVISMSKTKRKVDRQLNTLIKMAGGDRFSRMYEVAGVGDTNQAGQAYFNYGVSLIGFVNQDIFERAVHLYDAISSGARDVNRDDAPKDSAEF